jgi:uncharacterized protein YqjF (DUF2071 family)
MAQTWHDLLFAHWPISPAALIPLIPPPLVLDTYEGQAWVAVVPFRMSGVRPRSIPGVPWLSAFPELNVRTYVTAPDGSKPGVFFFSLEAANPIAVIMARRGFFLPYYHARMSVIDRGDHLAYVSTRTHTGAPRAEFAGRYGPSGGVYGSRPGTLEHWLTERYCLYTVAGQSRVYRGDIHHSPWPLQPAEAEIATNSMAAAAGISLPDIPPLLHFARRLDVVVWPLTRVSV